MPRPTLLPVIAAIAALGVATTAVAQHHHHESSRGRLVFADHEKPVVRILDLDTGEVTPSFPVPKANPVLSSTEDGRYVVIKTGHDAGTVRILDSGLVRDSHGDHDDAEKAEPK